MTMTFRAVLFIESKHGKMLLSYGRGRREI